jgi:hypothetical protein
MCQPAREKMFMPLLQHMEVEVKVRNKAMKQLSL